MVFNATFNNILAISWRSVLLEKETGVPVENHRLRLRQIWGSRDDNQANMEMPMY
jgi:hypothetical protein